jgi:hypothetical protein
VCIYYILFVFAALPNLVDKNWPPRTVTSCIICIPEKFLVLRSFRHFGGISLFVIISYLLLIELHSKTRMRNFAPIPSTHLTFGKGKASKFILCLEFKKQF